MVSVPLLPGITSTFVDTPRLQQHVLSSGPAEGEVVLLLHGNFSAAVYWEELMLALAEQGFRSLAPDLRGYGWTEDRLIDSTRGYREWADDVISLLDTLGVDRVHLVAWSMPGASPTASSPITRSGWSP